jgi:quaternary ammonium compound-resistance protein SugE
MSWLILVFSGALEAVWAAALHRTFQASGRRRIAPMLLFLASVLASMAGLAIAMQAIPTGTATPSGGRRRDTDLRIRCSPRLNARRRAPAALTGIAACVVGLKVMA